LIFLSYRVTDKQKNELEKLIIIHIELFLSSEKPIKPLIIIKKFKNKLILLNKKESKNIILELI